MTITYIILAILAVILLFISMFRRNSYLNAFWKKYAVPFIPITGDHKHVETMRLLKNIDDKKTELILISTFNYYQRLNDHDKTKFLRRVSSFISSREFKTMGELKLTEEMVILIAASAVQLTFGLDAFLLDNFSKIFIYPKEFYSITNKSWHKGETHLGGAIVLSWNNFVEGYDKPTDNRNLGLHEMAHALWFDKLKNAAYDTFFAEYVNKWQLIAGEEFMSIKNKQISYFRAYAGTNFSEFFSVCVEYFFESPHEFKKHHPDIYKHLSILLNQDPTSPPPAQTTVRSNASTENQEMGLQELIYKNNKNKCVYNSMLCTAVLAVIIIATTKADQAVTGILYLLLPLASFIRCYIHSKTILHVHTNGIRIRSVISRKFDKTYLFNQMVCIIFTGEQALNNKSCIKILVLKKGKINTEQFDFYFTSKDKKQLGYYFIEKQVPVKFDTLANLFHSSS